MKDPSSPCSDHKHKPVFPERGHRRSLCVTQANTSHSLTQPHASLIRNAHTVLTVRMLRSSRREMEPEHACGHVRVACNTAITWAWRLQSYLTKWSDVAGAWGECRVLSHKSSRKVAGRVHQVVLKWRAATLPYPLQCELDMTRHFSKFVLQNTEASHENFMDNPLFTIKWSNLDLFFLTFLLDMFWVQNILYLYKCLFDKRQLQSLNPKMYRPTVCYLSGILTI